jgi:hypothetical protein
MTLKVALRSYYELYQTIPDSTKSFSDKTIPGLLSSIDEKVHNFSSSLNAAFTHEQRTSQLEPLCLHGLDLPRRSTLSELERKKISYLNVHPPILDDFAIALRVYSQEELFSHLTEALGFLKSPLEVASTTYHHDFEHEVCLPRRVHFFFHSLMCGHQIIHHEPLGEGTYGKVNQVSLRNHRFACKQQVKKVVSHITSFKKELCILLQLRHPHIISLTGAYCSPTQDVTLYLELCAQTLGNFMKGVAPFSIKPAECHKILLQLSSALAYLHKKDIIHKDLKSDNILLNAHGDVRLCDFGFSTLHNRERQTHVSCTYAAPETLHSHLMTPKCDVWSFGVLVYRLITRNFPYPQLHTESDLAYRHRIYQLFYETIPSTQPPPLFAQRKWDTFDPQNIWTKLIEDCLQGNFHYRPSMEDVHDYLKKHSHFFRPIKFRVK